MLRITLHNLQEIRQRCEILKLNDNLLASIFQLPVTIDIELVEILEISERDSKFQTKSNLRMTWMDSRVTIYNLKDDANLNTLPANERNSIWVPVLTFNNTKNNMETVNDRKSIASALKVGNYTKSGMDFADNIYIFKV